MFIYDRLSLFSFSFFTQAMDDMCDPLFTPQERAAFSLRDCEGDSSTAPENSPKLRAYRLSDEGAWRSWSNLYTTGVWIGSEQQEEQGTDATRAACSNVAKSSETEQRTLKHHAAPRESDEAVSKSSTTLVNVLFSRAQVAEDRERKRVMGNKFNFTDTATELWNYIEPPLLASFFTDLVELLKCPCALDDNLFRPEWPATPWESVNVLRLTIAYMEAQVCGCSLNLPIVWSRK